VDPPPTADGGDAVSQAVRVWRMAALDLAIVQRPPGRRPAASTAHTKVGERAPGRHTAVDGCGSPRPAIAAAACAGSAGAQPSRSASCVQPG
jgi:hypothetical protein